MASTGYRFVRYYTHDPAYRRKGPPEIVLRLIAPIVVLSTIGVFATGIGLMIDGPDRSQPDAARSTRSTFIVWVVFTSLHILGHLPAVGRALGVGGGALVNTSRRRRARERHRGRRGGRGERHRGGRRGGRWALDRADRRDRRRTLARDRPDPGFRGLDGARGVRAPSPSSLTAGTRKNGERSTARWAADARWTVVRGVASGGELAAARQPTRSRRTRRRWSSAPTGHRSRCRSSPSGRALRRPSGRPRRRWSWRT